jgi:hypothetical protein
MNISPQNYAEICKQLAQISALVAGFSFAFISVLLTNTLQKKITDWVIGFSISTIAGFLICALTWTLCATRMSLLMELNTKNVPEMFIHLHRILSFLFVMSFFLFFVTLGLTGWIRSRKLGIFSSVVALLSTISFLWLMNNFNV